MRPGSEAGAGGQERTCADGLEGASDVLEEAVVRARRVQEGHQQGHGARINDAILAPGAGLGLGAGAGAGMNGQRAIAQAAFRS